MHKKIDLFCIEEKSAICCRKLSWEKHHSSVNSRDTTNLGLFYLCNKSLVNATENDKKTWIEEE